MNSFALYRLPDQQEAVRIASSRKPVACHYCEELSGLSGFAIAPFTISNSEPILVIAPDEVEHFIPPKVELKPYSTRISLASTVSSELDRESYARDFAKMRKKLEDSTFSKIVLARQKRIETEGKLPAIELFYKACAMYPHQMIMLAYTQQSGTWITATPETLLQGAHAHWRTVALAGTMKISGDSVQWSEKNIHEQQIVAKYIHQCLKKFSNDIQETEAVTTQAGDLLHLKTEFNFTINDERQLGQLIDALYPTPAVCGMPKKATRQFIIDHESQPRSYYSGFMGPLNIEGETNLFVSLRCMRIANKSCTLYAGGGLISESNQQSEWAETEAKMETMKNLIC